VEVVAIIYGIVIYQKKLKQNLGLSFVFKLCI